MLGELASTSQARISEYRLRKSRFDQKTFRKDESDYAISEGWELLKENQATLRFQKLKVIDEQLENEFWCLVYNLGYPNLNVGRNFQIKVGSTLAKQIDVFAFDEETIIVAECKTSDKRARKSLQKDIGEFAANQRPISNTLRQFFGGKFDQKIIWFFVTKNIDWSEPDRARAIDANIRIITEKELFYYKEIAKRVGHSARYQFHAEFLSKTKVSALEHKAFSLRTKLGPHRVFAFFAPAKTILPLTFVNHRDLRDPNAAPSYQRLIHRPKLRDIAAFLKAGGFFPNAIILNIKKKARFDILKPEDDDGIAAGELTLPNTYKSVWIIDGQHRLYGYTEIDNEEVPALLPFLAFENISLLDETKLFADINSKQKSVSKKLLDEISGEIKLDSADKREQIRAIASRCFDLMREDENGPLGEKIAGAEVKKSDDSILTVPFLVDATIQAGLLGKVSASGSDVSYLQGPLSWDDPTEAITSLAALLSGYFELFRLANVDRWNSGKNGKFATNTGIAALIRLLADLIIYMAWKEKEDPRTLHPTIITERIERYLEPCTRYFRTATDEDVAHRFQTPFGSGGPRVFQHRLRELINAVFRDFKPQGFEEDLRKYDADRRARADRMVQAIQESVHRCVVNKLKEIYGEGDDYIEKAVKNKEILKSAFNKKIEDESGSRDLATYLDFIELRKIIETPKNWEHFKSIYSIQMPSEKNAGKFLTWFDDVNKMRRVSAHPYNRGYDDGEVERLTFVYAKLKERGIIGDRS